MTTDVAVWPPTADMPAIKSTADIAEPAPAVYRLRNPWVARLVVGSAIAIGALLGAFAGNLVFDAEALDGVAAVALLAAVLVTGLAWRTSRFEKCPPGSAFVPSTGPDLRKWRGRHGDRQR